MAEGPTTLTGKCAQCGTAFEFIYSGSGRRKAICDSPDCMRRRNRLAGERHRRANGAIPWDEAIAHYKVAYRKRPELTQCRHCGASFGSRTGRTKSGAKEFCSQACNAAVKRNAAIERRRVIAWQCSTNLFLGQLADWCRLAFCRSCSGLVERERQHSHTVQGNRCQSCADQSKMVSRRKSRRIRKAMDRARLKRVKVEQVDPIKVFDRDGWRCHLCGYKTPKEKRGTYHPKAPELDHIVPLSKGGAHSYANTACSCRKCNAEKSDKILGQPSLLTA